tara:strand:+ start:25084 stop:25878 length:795 start_codon:yes stop_codon:yes gene_type:complete
MNFRIILPIIVLLLISILNNNFVSAETFNLIEQKELFEQALLDSNNNNFEQALGEWDQYLDDFPNDPAAHSNRGNIRLTLGDIEGAIEDQNIAIKLSPNEYDPYINRGIAQEAKQNWDKAAEDYLKVIENDSANPSAIYNLANVRNSQCSWREARDLYKKASSISSGFVMARSSMALLDYQLGNYEAAENEFRKLIRKYPYFADARAGLTALLWQKGAFGEAESNWVAASGLDIRYSNNNWLTEIRRWPPNPATDLDQFLSLNR